MFLSEHFTFDNVRSEEMYGATIINFGDKGSRIVGAEFSILEETAGTSYKPYYYGVKANPISFPLNIGFRDKNGIAIKLNIKERQRVIEWLCPSDGEYKAFTASEDNSLVYYIKVLKFAWKEYLNGDSLAIDVRTDSGYAYSPMQNIYVNNIRNKESQLEIVNYSNVDKFYQPVIEFTTYGAYSGYNALIKNLDTGDEMKFINLENNEKLEIDCARRLISSSTGKFRYDNRQGTFFRLKYGVNRVMVNGNLEMNIKLQFPMLMN